MGKKLNLSHLSEEECEKILGVLQKDFQVRRAEKKRVNVVHNELVKEQNRISVLKENPKFNDNSCIVCLERFGIFIRRKKTCYKCLLNVCPSCCSEVLRERKKVIVCSVCSKEKAYRLLSNEWLGRPGKSANKNYGTAKVVRSLYKRFSSSFSDTELDSGYPPSSISSAPAAKPRPRLDQVFDLYRGVSQEDDERDKDDDHDDDDDEELPPSSPKTAILSKPIARATSLDTLVISPRESAFQSRQDPLNALPPRPVSVTPTGTQTQSQSQEFVRRAQTPDQFGARPRSQDFDLQRSKKKKGKDAHGLYKEALEGAKRSEEFKFRVKFDQLLGDLHLAIEEKSPNGLPNSFASPSYGEVMLTFRDKVKDILKGFSQRLVLAYDSFGSLENPEQTSNQVKQDISRFIEDLIGESLELTSDEAVSDLSSLSDDSAVDQNSFEDLVAQAVVSKLLENHRKEVSGALLGERNRSSSSLSLPDASGPNVIRLVVKDQATETANLTDDRTANSENHQETELRVKRKSSPHHLRSTGVGDSVIDSVDGSHKGKFSRHRRRRNSVESLFSNRSELIPDFDDDEGDDNDNDGEEDLYDDYEDEDQEEDVSGSENSDDEDEGSEDNRANQHNARRRHLNRHRTTTKNLKNAVSLDNVSNGIPYNRNDSLRGSKKLSKSDDVINREHSDNFLIQQDGGGDDNVADVVKDFEELKEFVRKTQATARPRVECKLIDDSQELEVQEEQVSRTVVNHEEKSENFHTRVSALDRVLHSEPPLPDFSQFENIDFASQEVDPDLLSMNLAIIPEETEEELEQEEEEVDENGLPGRWRTNWIFKGTGVSPYENMGRKKMMVESDQPLYMTVPNPGEDWTPWRDLEEASDHSDSDLLNGSDLDKSEDDEESPFYANTSRELARISGSRHRGHRRESSSSLGHDDLMEGSDEDMDILSQGHSKNGHLSDADEELEDIPGPIIEPGKQELKLLTDLVPADNDDPKFLISPESVTIQEGEPVRFSCQVTGTPPIDIFWYREGDEVEELEDSEDVELANNGEKHSAILYNIGKKMAGQYMCIALSDMGKAIQYLVVTVKDNKQDLKKPEFLKGLADIEVTEGQSVKFRVKVKGYPPPRISWYKDGVLLRNSKACRIEKFGNRDYILTIDYATMDDDAEYTVSARNVAGEAKSSAQVIVEPQSELPAKKQRLPSVSSIQSTDSESAAVSKYLDASPSASASIGTSSAAPPSPAARKRQNQQQITQLDRKLSMTQKRVEEEANKMQEDAEKLSTINCTLDAVDLRLDSLETSLPSLPSLSARSNRSEEGKEGPGPAQEHKRILTTNVLDMLHASEETLQQEKNKNTSQNTPSSDSSPYRTQNSSQHENKDEVDGPQLNGSPPTSPPLQKDNVLGDFSLPDRLDDFPMPGLQTKTPVPGKSTLNFTIQGNHQDQSLDEDFVIQKRRPEKFTSEVSLKNFAGPPPPETKSLLPDTSVTAGDQDMSFDSGKDVSLSLASSISSDASTKENSDDVIADAARQHSLRKGFYSRDFEVSKQQETKKWSVTLDPFSPKAEVVNRQNDKQTGLEISITDLSPLSSQPSSKEDNSGQSSPRQSVDSGIYVHRPKEHPAPVHMVGDTSEHDVPESRTEFNVDDGAIELPSVNRLRAMFSSGSQLSNPALTDDLGDGSFKRRSYTDQNAQKVHSITARSVPKQQLEQLRAMNQSSPSSSSSSSSSSTHLQVPGMASKSSAVLQLTPSSSSSPSSILPPTSSSSSSSKMTVRSGPSNQPVPAQRHNAARVSDSGKYEVHEPGKEPILIYPMPDSSNLQLTAHPTQQTGLQNNTINKNNNVNNNGQATDFNLSSKGTRAETPSQGRIPTRVSSPPPSSAQPKKPPRAQPRLVVRRASENEEGSESGRAEPRIKSGYISARAAFWERKIVDGGLVDSGEFPDMVEDSDS